MVPPIPRPTAASGATLLATSAVAVVMVSTTGEGRAISFHLHLAFGPGQCSDQPDENSRPGSPGEKLRSQLGSHQSKPLTKPKPRTNARHPIKAPARVDSALTADPPRQAARTGRQPDRQAEQRVPPDVAPEAQSRRDDAGERERR